MWHVAPEDFLARGLETPAGEYSDLYYDTVFIGADGGVEYADGEPISQDVRWPGVHCLWGGECVERADFGYCGACGAMMPDATPGQLDKTHHGRAILAEVTKGLSAGQYRFRVTVRSEFTDLVIKVEDVVACGYMFAGYAVRRIAGQYVSDVQLTRA